MDQAERSRELESNDSPSTTDADPVLPPGGSARMPGAIADTAGKGKGKRHFRGSPGFGAPLAATGGQP